MNSHGRDKGGAGGSSVKKWNKYRFGEFGKFKKSQWHFAADTPIAGPFEAGQARKTAGNNTAEKKSIHLFVCWKVFKTFLQQLVQDRTVKNVRN